MSLAQEIRDEIEELSELRRKAWAAGNGVRAKDIGFRLDDLYELLRTARAADSPEHREAVNIEYDPHARGTGSKVKTTDISRVESKYAQHRVRRQAEGLSVKDRRTVAA